VVVSHRSPNDGRRARLDERDLSLRQEACALSRRVLVAILITVTAATEIYLTSGNTLQLDANTFWVAATWVIVYLPAPAVIVPRSAIPGNL